MRKVIVLIGLILLFNLSACTTRKIDDNSKLIRVAFWGAPEEVKIIKEITDKWQIENPDIKIKLDHTNYSEYGSKILTQIAGGAAPDVIFTEVDMFINFVKKGVLAPLDQFIEKDTEFKLNDFFPEVVQRFIVDDKLYCIPRDTAPFACVYYNKGLFDEAGISYPKDNWTWDDLLEKAQKLTIFNEDGRVKQYGFYTWAWKNFVYGNGGALVDDVSNPTKCLLNEEKAIQGLEFYADLINKYKVMPAPVAMDNLGMGVHAMFVMGKVGMFCSGIWETPVLKNKTKIMLLKGKKFDWDIVMFPRKVFVVLELEVLVIV